MNRPSPTREQLRVIAALTRADHFDRVENALRPFARDHLVLAYDKARGDYLDAVGAVRRIELARYAHAATDPLAPPLPLDVPRHQAAMRLAAQKKVELEAAWSRIQAIIDRARQLLRELPSSQGGQ